MSTQLLKTDDYALNLLSPSWSGPVVLYISNEHFGDAGEKISSQLASANNSPFTMCELLVKDWDKYLTPWEAQANMQGRTFAGEAKVLLSHIKDEILPVIRDNAGDSKVYIAGYSLAGLFALWSLYECGLFDGAACCSGSVWYPGWREYASSHKVQKAACVYLSLGLKEKNTKHPLMKTVEDNMRYQYELLTKDEAAERVQLDWNEGGHFSGTQERMVKGISWLYNSYESAY